MVFDFFDRSRRPRSRVTLQQLCKPAKSLRLERAKSSKGACFIARRFVRGGIIHAMARPASTHVIAAAILACLSASPAFAQSERINIRSAPRPDQTVQMTMNQSMDLDLTIESGGALPASPGPMKMAMRMTMEMTQKTGTARPDGSYDSELTIGDAAAPALPGISMQGTMTTTIASK